MKQPKIVIVGAGPSGIATASKLFESGFNNVKLLEAEDRIGGRVHTTNIGDYLVDLGGEWVHGEEGNVAYELAAPLGLLEKTGRQHYGRSQKLLDSQGKPVSSDLQKSIADFYSKYVEQTTPDNVYKSYGDYIEKMFEQEFKNNSQIYKDKKKYLHHLELYILAMESAESWHDVAIDDDGFKGFPGDQMICWKTRGYSTILDILMKRFPDATKELPVMKNVILNSEVTTIDYSKDSDVIITTAKGQTFKADHVVVTVPLGVLKTKSKSLFIPKLTNEKAKAIENFGYGSIAKIFLLFDQPFWDSGDEKLQISFVWNEAERKQIEEDPQKAWLLGILGITTVEYKPNLLVMFVTGKYAKAMESQSDGAIRSHVTENLHRFLGKTYNVTDPTAVLRTEWYTNPNFGGTFAYRSTKTQKERVQVETWQEPLNSENLKILFAGEATSLNRFSTVDGAIVTGWKAADKLIDYYKKTSS